MDFSGMVRRRGRYLPENEPEEQRNRIDLSLYSSKLGVDIFYRRTGNNYKIHKINGFPEDIPANYSENFNGIKVDIRGLNLYYIFNNRKFSYPAAFSQSTNQRRNAGSFIAGFPFQNTILSLIIQNFPISYWKQ